MSRYYFHIRDGGFFVPDEEGVECGTIAAIESEARASRRDLARAALGAFLPRIPPNIEIEDEDGNAVICMTYNPAIN